MNLKKLLDNTQSIIFSVNSAHEIQFISPHIAILTFELPENLVGKKCYQALLNQSAPCKFCPVLREEKHGGGVHDIISPDGERRFFNSALVSDGKVYFETLTDISKIKKDNDVFRHENKRLKALQVTESLKGQEAKNNYDFLHNIIDNFGFGVMVVKSDYSIVLYNKTLKNLLRLRNEKGEDFKCYNAYKRTEPCKDCPFRDKRVIKAQKTVDSKNFTIQFESFNDYIVETIRDTTREIQLINEIRISNDEIQEKQRQMQLLNKDLLRMNDRLKAAQKVIDEELKQVGNLQQSLLPEELPTVKGYEFGAFYTPAEHAGGDYYDCIEMSNNFWGFTVADVSGHGTPAAVIMAMARAIMRSYTYDVVSSSEAMYMVNEILCDNVHTRDFVTMFYMVLNTAKSELNYASAGHNPILHFDKSEMIVRQLTADGLFLAAFPGIDYEEKTLRMDDGDIIFMYTDGLVEAMNSKREQYGLDKVISRIMMYHDTTCDRIIQEIMSDVKEFTENIPFDDDVTILTIKKLEKNSENNK